MSVYSMKMPYGEYPGQYLPNHWATDYNPALGEVLDYGEYMQSTSTKAVYAMDNGVDFIISGKGLTYEPVTGVLNGGTVTSLSLVDADGGGVMQTITGLKWSGDSFYNTVKAGSSWYTASVILQGNDTLKGSSGDDEMWSFAGNDKLIGGAGFDNLIGGRGKDTYDGGTSSGDIDQLGFDDAYSDAKGAKGVSVDMAKGTDIDPWGNHETFKNIERIKGTQFADKFLGSAGDDQFRGLGGKDQIDGRGGEDTVRYDRDAGYDGNKGVKVDLAAGTAIDGFGDKDTLKSIENVVGSAFKDVLNGSNAANRLTGGAGQDTLFGGAGADTFVFGDGFGRDTIKDFHAAGKGHDFIDLSDFSSARNFADLEANHLSQHGKDVWIDGEAGDILVVKGTEIADLVKADFIF